MKEEAIYRSLTAEEMATLERLGNRAEDWAEIRVKDGFDPTLVRDNEFGRDVKIGALARGSVDAEGLELKVGIYRSVLTEATLGDDVAVHSVRFLSGYDIGKGAVLFNVGEMTCRRRKGDYAWMEPMNENGGRRIMPFPDMRIGDAYLWARYRGKEVFVRQLEEFAAAAMEEGERRGRVGESGIVKNCAVVRDICLLSSAEERTVADGCTVLEDGVAAEGCRMEHGVHAVRFMLGEHVHLEYGLRLNDSAVGDNSTLARCEVGNSVIFPAHEQHHNNSFLIAALIKGQSNVAAGGTIGSNHNSRTADGELCASRGFWPGLCCSFKHPSRFASYCLVAKGDYPHELDIRLPFALVNNNAAKDRLEVMPAYWWMYNMYALDRNSTKFARRDRRKRAAQHIDFSPFAPDTAEELLCGMTLLRGLTEGTAEGKVWAERMEKGKREVCVLKAAEGLKAYREMLYYYSLKTYFETPAEQRLQGRCNAEERTREWENIGGQIVPKEDVERLIEDVERGRLRCWDEVHQRLDALWEEYPRRKAEHAYAILCMLEGTSQIGAEQIEGLQGRYDEICSYIEEQRKLSRKKDDEDPYRRMMYYDEEEQRAVLG